MEEKKQDRFTVEELQKIYEASGRSVDIEALREAARRLYPERMAGDTPASLYVLDKPYGRAFRRGADPDEYEKPTHTIASIGQNLLAVFADGESEPY